MKHAILFLLLACLHCQALLAEEPLKVGVLVPMSGPAGFLGELEIGGVEIARDRFNKQRTAGIPPLEVIIEDSQSDPKTAVTGFNKLVAAGVQIVYVSLTSANMAIKPLAERSGIVVVAESSHPTLTAGAEYMFRNMYSTSTAAQEVLKRLKSAGHRTLAIFHTEDEFGSSGADELEALARWGGSTEIVSRQSFKTTDHDVRAQVLAIAKGNPRAIYLLGIGPVQAVAIQQLRQQQLHAEIIGYNLCSQGNVLRAAGDAAEGVLSLEPDVDEEGALWKEFQSEFLRRYPSVTFQALAGLGYEFIQIAEAAARNGKRRASEIRTFLASGVKISGIMSELQFDQGRNVIHKPLRLRIVRDGACTDLEAIF